MGVAKVAIIGRPNVGKSSIFNWLIGERVSIVDSVAGVTRDRVSFLLDLGLDGVSEEYLAPQDLGLNQSESIDVVENKSEGEASSTSFDDQQIDESPIISARYIELIDSGGIGIVDKDDLSSDVEYQIEMAIHSADVILFVVDARDGITPLDQYVADRLRVLKVPILLVANKCDGETQEHDSGEFHCWGWQVIPVSAKQKYGRYHLRQDRRSQREYLLRGRQALYRHRRCAERRRGLRVRALGRKQHGRYKRRRAKARLCA